MLRLAVASRAETFERMQDPLAQRGINAFHLRPKERAIPVTGPEPAPIHEELPDGGADVGFVYPSRLMRGSIERSTETSVGERTRSCVAISEQSGVAGTVRRSRSAGS